MKGVKTVIIYKQTGGKVCADGAAVDVARLIVSHGRIRAVVSTGHIIDAIRVMIKKGEIGIDEVEFQFEGKVLPHDENGRILHWPNGFNDTTIDLLSQL